MNIYSFYKSILTMGAMKLGDDGLIYTNVGNKDVVVKVGGKPLAMPTNDMVNKAITKDAQGATKLLYEFFHPLKEDIITPESKSLRMLRKAISAKVNFMVYYIIHSLLVKIMNNGASTTDHNLLDLLSTIKLTNTSYDQLVDEKTLTRFDAIFTAYHTQKGVKSTFISFFIKRGAKVNDKKYNRATILAHPMLKELEASTDRTIKGTKLRIKDMDVVKGLIKYIFNDDECNTVYTSDSETSPGLESLLSATYDVVSRLNNIMEKFDLMTDDSGVAPLFNMDWVDYIRNIELHYGEIKTVPLNSVLLTNTETPIAKEPITQPGTNTSVNYAKATDKESTNIAPSSGIASHTAAHPGAPVKETNEIVHTDRGLDPRSLAPAPSMTPYGMPMQHQLPQYGMPMNQMQQPMGMNHYPQQQYGMPMNQMQHPMGMNQYPQQQHYPQQQQQYPQQRNSGFNTPHNI